MFQVPKEYKQQLKMVMFEYYEQMTTDSTDGSTVHTESSYTVLEEED